MKAVVQRAKNASVTVEGGIIGHIEEGMLVLLGIGHDDNETDVETLAGKIARLRIFPDDQAIPNLSLIDTGLEALVVSQFTLMAKTRKGNRPSYIDAARPELAERLYERFVVQLKELIGATNVATGRFGAMMDISFVNQGPYTLILESKAG